MPQWCPAPTFDPATGFAAPDAKPLMMISPTIIPSVGKMPIWWLIQPSTGGPQRNAMYPMVAAAETDAAAVRGSSAAADIPSGRVRSSARSAARQRSSRRC